jgi:hypothetical protein
MASHTGTIPTFSAVSSSNDMVGATSTNIDLATKTDSPWLSSPSPPPEAAKEEQSSTNIAATAPTTEEVAPSAVLAATETATTRLFVATTAITSTNGTANEDHVEKPAPSIPVVSTTTTSKSASPETQNGELFSATSVEDAAAASLKDAGNNVSSSASPPPPLPPPPPASPVMASVLPKRVLGKRPSPWREPRVDHKLPPPAKDIVVNHATKKRKKVLDPERAAKKAARKQKRLYSKLFQDSVTVHIPLGVTGTMPDMSVALQRIRAKRVAAIYQHFPSLLVQPVAVGAAEHKSKSSDNENDNDDMDVHDKTKGELTVDKEEKKKKLLKLKHVPQPHEYASVLDYLEAKYVQGVVIDDGAAGSGTDVDDEGQGSVYSETSFLDDTGLQRTVAEQVLGHTTTTKLEMQDSDDAFFVNVGDLEVEETDLTQRHYDPLEDTKGSGKKKTRKRKKATTTEAKENTTETSNGKAKKANGKAATAATSKKPSTPASVESPKAKKAKTASKEDAGAKAPSSNKKIKSEPIVKDPSVLKLQKTAKSKKAIADQLFIDLVGLLKGFTEDELPRKAKPKRTRVVVKITPDKKPGDMITFANPHVPGQKLKVKVPPNTKPGDSFKVTVPKPAEEEDADENPGKDHNKISRDFYDKLEDYARTYDEWCDAEGQYRKAIGEKGFTPHFAKREKFEKLISEFPKDMKTPVDKDYLKKILRRARQNKHKREQTLARQQQQPSDSKNGDEDRSDSGGGSGSDDSSSDDDDDDNIKKEESTTPTKASPPKPAVKKTKPMRTAVLPDLSLVFPTKQFNLDDFN